MGKVSMIFSTVSSYIEKYPVSIMKEASQKLKESINIIDR